MARRIYKVSEVGSRFGSRPSKTVPGAFDPCTVHYVAFTLDDPSVKDILLDGELDIIAYDKSTLDIFTLGKRLTIEVIDNPTL